MNGKELISFRDRLYDRSKTNNYSKKKSVTLVPREVPANVTAESIFFSDSPDESPSQFKTEQASQKYWAVTSDPEVVAKSSRVFSTANGKVATVFIAESQDRVIDEHVKKIVEETGRFALPGNILPYGVKPGRLFRSKTAPASLVGGQIAEVRDVEPEVLNESFKLPHKAMTSTRLGDMYADIFEPNDWPMEMALPALVSAASVIVPRMARPADGSMPLVVDPMVNLYTAQIAPVNAGKSQVIEWGAKALGVYRALRGPHYYALKAGSAEQLFKNLSKYRKDFEVAVLINPDEWAHMLKKASIKDASFSSVLTSAFYQRDNVMTVGGQGGGKEFSLNDLAISITGGIVQEDFGTVFGAETLGGLYDRFLFGLAPEGFKWNWREFPQTVKAVSLDDLAGAYDPNQKPNDWLPVPVLVDPSVSEVIKSWNKQHKDWGRITEVCSRVATIFASVDGRKVVTGKDLEALEPLARFQMDIRSIYKPNAGQNPDAQFANAAEAWVNKHAANWRTLRDLKKGLNTYEAALGPNVAERSLYALARAGRIELWVNSTDRQGSLLPMPADYEIKGRRPTGLVRRVREE